MLPTSSTTPTRPVKPEPVVRIRRDTREQAGYALAEFPAGTVLEVATMATADYCAVAADGRALTERCLIERKTIGDLLGCIGRDRERFQAELVRMAEETRTALLLVENIGWRDLLAGRWNCPGEITTQAAVGSLVAWAQRHRVHLVCAGDRATAARVVWQHCRRAILDEAAQAVAAQGQRSTLPTAGEWRELERDAAELDARRGRTP